MPCGNSPEPESMTRHCYIAALVFALTTSGLLFSACDDDPDINVDAGSDAAQDVSAVDTTDGDADMPDEGPDLGPQCGNDVVEDGEACDGDSEAAEALSCASLLGLEEHEAYGIFRCNDDCEWDLSECFGQQTL